MIEIRNIFGDNVSGNEGGFHGKVRQGKEISGIGALGLIIIFIGITLKYIYSNNTFHQYWNWITPSYFGNYWLIGSIFYVGLCSVIYKHIKFFNPFKSYLI